MAFRLCRSGDMEYMSSSLIEAANMFTTRRGGNSRGIYESLNLRIHCDDDREAVRCNYETVCRALGTRSERLVFSAQVHGDTIRLCTSADSRGELFTAKDYEADALMTGERGLPLAVFIADCVPVLLYAPEAPAIAAVHAGWRGTAKDIAGKAVERMCREFGSKPGNLRAAIGQSIGACCFETGPEVPEAMRAALGAEAEAFIGVRPGGKFSVDLKGVNRALLLRRGLRAENIDVSEECTSCNADKYWSHRRTKGERGANAALIMLP